MTTSRFAPAGLAPGVIGGLALVLAGCGGGHDPGTATLSPMAYHYQQVALIQEAIIAGSVDDTRAHARALATHRDESYPASAAASLEAMRTEARVMAQQRQILDVARTLGRMGAACGACHTATGRQLNILVREPPPMSANPAAHMQRHAWAVDRLWEGLVGPSNTAWVAGAGALATMPADFGGNDQANRLAKRVHELSDKARSTADAQDRAQVYGDVLETCALCHDALRMRIR